MGAESQFAADHFCEKGMESLGVTVIIRAPVVRQYLSAKVSKGKCVLICFSKFSSIRAAFLSQI